MNIDKLRKFVKECGLEFCGDKVIANPTRPAEDALNEFADKIINHCVEIANYMEDMDDTDIGPEILKYFKR